MVLIHSADAGYGAVTADVTVTVRDGDESTDMTAMQAAQQMWLPRFGLTAVEHMLGGLDYRCFYPDMSMPGVNGVLAILRILSIFPYMEWLISNFAYFSLPVALLTGGAFLLFLLP